MSQTLSALAPTSPVYAQGQQMYAQNPSVKVTETIVTEQCAKPVSCAPKDPCAQSHHGHNGYDMGHGWGWLGALIMWLLIFIVFFWLVFFSLKPAFVLTNGAVDTAKVLLASVIAAVILVIIIWLIKLAVSRNY